MDNKDTDMDGIISDDIAKRASLYADQLTIQLKKGLLNYCVLLACQSRAYASEIIAQLWAADLSVVEGTIYPILSRMQKDGLLDYIWQESKSGPPRKYYQITPYGTQVQRALATNITAINQSITNLVGGVDPDVPLIHVDPDVPSSHVDPDAPPSSHQKPKTRQKNNIERKTP